MPSFNQGKRLAGFLGKIERRTIGGPTAKKYWFVLDQDSPYLYWFKNETDISCLGRISLSGAIFTFDPRETVKMEIHSQGEVHILECPDSKSRTRWLQHLQGNRKWHYERESLDDIDVPAGIPLDDDVPTNEATRTVLHEAAVDDVDQLKDLVMGYQAQNYFLNQEIMDLQQIVQQLEVKDRDLTLQNYEVEASYYQLKSRYLMVLNHFRIGFEDSMRQLEPQLIEKLIEDVSRPLNFMHRTESVSRKRSLSVVLNTVAEGAVADSQGFYIQSPPPKENSSTTTSLQSPEAMMDKAAELKSLADHLIESIKMEKNKQYAEWIQKWDCYLVNYSSNETLATNHELKALVRQGIPHAYRSRVWKSLVEITVGNLQADSGKGYYQCLLKKVDNVKDPSADPCLNQILLDLGRTLPTNVHFIKPNSPKMGELRRVLSAFRFHNKSVGYCQGLNRIVAVALLYLKEDDAFWFLVAVVEYLQPPDYYTANLHGASVDQKVLLDLVQEKLPKVANHLKVLGVDLSIFTLSWFLTIFVDALHHKLYLPIFDSFLLEGNKVVFRFAIALLKTIETNILNCSSIGSINAYLSNMMSLKIEPTDLAKAAFNIHSFPLKSIETRRQQYLNLSKK